MIVAGGVIVIVATSVLMVVPMIAGNGTRMAVPAILAGVRVSATARGTLPRFIERDCRLHRTRRRCVPLVVARPKALREHKPRPESLDHGRFLPKVTESLNSL
ncbi:MAG TPA: hypothetical protein VJS30_10500 [Paraburkholderia sp.]|nr:hypothetical protein [Paraburkholderia sp.]